MGKLACLCFSHPYPLSINKHEFGIRFFTNWRVLIWTTFWSHIKVKFKGGVRGFDSMEQCHSHLGFSHLGFSLPPCLISL